MYLLRKGIFLINSVPIHDKTKTSRAIIGIENKGLKLVLEISKNLLKALCIKACSK